MSKLIDADAFIKHWNSEWRHLHPDDCYLVALRNFPAVDAVEVVRCRECKHMILQSHTRYCTVWHAVNGMGDDGFCNYGERKEGADNG